MSDDTQQSTAVTTAQTTSPAVASKGQRISIAIVAMGGQGGGVLADWFVSLAEANGWIVQNTSVPGVAQRTGATIYYIELFKRAAGETAEPVLALMPGSGDVDLVIAAEWMEAGRAIMRGLVTPDRTTFIASTHRAYATVEKMVPGNGMADGESVEQAAAVAARQLVAFDMASIAEEAGTVISAPLFGAVAATDVLPFDLSAYEAAIKAGGKGIERSLKGLHAAYEQAKAQQAASGETGGVPGAPNSATVQNSAVSDDDSSAEAPTLALPSGKLGERLAAMPMAAQAFALEGTRRCIDYLDQDYANQYLHQLEALVHKMPDDELVTEVARWLALRMCYEDPIRVADLKARRERFDDIAKEVRAADRQIIHHTEYMHPRLEEIVDTLPMKWSQRLQNSKLAQSMVNKAFGKGMLLRTSTLRGFIMIWVLSRFSGWRRQSPRHAREMASIQSWLESIERLGKDNLPLGRAVARTARLIKGYSDTHERGTGLYERLGGIANSLMGRDDGGAILDYLIGAALADADGKALEKAIGELNAANAVRNQTTGQAA
ncbi:MAG: indolepyruvate oxidoreductase subunit beta family protein [Burkholderiaceae bacterium]